MKKFIVLFTLLFVSVFAKAEVQPAAMAPVTFDLSGAGQAWEVTYTIRNDSESNEFYLDRLVHRQLLIKKWRGEAEDIKREHPEIEAVSHKGNQITFRGVGKHTTDVVINSTSQGSTVTSTWMPSATVTLAVKPPEAFHLEPRSLGVTNIAPAQSQDKAVAKASESPDVLNWVGQKQNVSNIPLPQPLSTPAIAQNSQTPIAISTPQPGPKPKLVVPVAAVSATPIAKATPNLKPVVTMEYHPSFPRVDGTEDVPPDTTGQIPGFTMILYAAGTVIVGFILWLCVKAVKRMGQTTDALPVHDRPLKENLGREKVPGVATPITMEKPSEKDLANQRLKITAGAMGVRPSVQVPQKPDSHRKPPPMGLIRHETPT